MRCQDKRNIKQSLNQNQLMEAFDFDPQILHTIFREQSVTEEVVRQLADWIHSLDPSFGLLKSLLTQYFQSDNWEVLMVVGKRIEGLLVGLQETKCPKCFIRALLAVIKVNMEKMKGSLNVQMIASKWGSINPQVLEYFFEAFDLSVDTLGNKENKVAVKIPLEEYEARIREFIDKRDYEGAITLIKMIGYPQEFVRLLLERMANNKDASKAAGLIRSHKIDPKLVPQIGERLNKNMIRYFLKSHGWQLTQEIFFDSPEALVVLTEDLIFRKCIQEAISLWWRHPEMKQHIVKKDSLALLQQQTDRSKQQIQVLVVENTLFRDYFGPFDPQTQLTLKELGIERQSVIWVEQQPERIDQLINQMKKAEILAIDTESIVGKTKLQRKKMQSASIVQIAFPTSVFVIDGSRCNSEALRVGLLDYIQSGRPILGHAISNDLNAMLLSLGISEQDLGMVKFTNIIDTNLLFKGIYPKQRHSNLAHICKTVLKKEICKKQTLSNWSRRPLRDNQIHYAAMDAFCLLRVFEALKEEVGENMLNYFLNRDFE